MPNFFGLLSAVLLLSTSALTMAVTLVPDDYSNNVVWTSPSKDAAGSMPLGNGEVGINLWAQDNGDLVFYISRSDSLSEISRLIKVGQIRISLSPNPFADGAPFRQILRLRDGVCDIAAGAGSQRVDLKIFVDSGQPVIHCIGTSSGPLKVTVSTANWRTEAHTVADGEASSAWTMQGAPFPLVESADVFPNVGAGAIAWYHRNENSPAFTSTLSVQSLQPRGPDPLLHRTFGGWVSAAGFVKSDNLTLVTGAPLRSFDIRVSSPCLQCAGPEQWLIAANDAAKSSNTAAAEQRTESWWREYWNRSWIMTGGLPAPVIPGADHNLRIGYDSNGSNKFPGSLGRTSVYDYALNADEIGQLAKTQPSDPSPVALRQIWTGMGAASEIPAGKVQFKSGYTLEAWIKPDGNNVGRIFDKLTAGQDDGFLFDVYPQTTLRFIMGNQTVHSDTGALNAGVWQHVALSYDTATRAVRMYINGKLTANLPGTDTRLTINQAYTLQRYVQACEGRGSYPIKFNGGIFTVEPAAMGRPYNPDYRQWGDSHWFQNIRHMYHPMLASGDYEMMDPFFRMYEDAVPLAEERSQLYYGAQGTYFPETMTNWGTYANSDYGWNRAGQKPGDIDSPWWRYAWNQGPELVALMLDRWDYTQDPVFLKSQLLPMADTVLKYFDTRFKKDSDGRILLDPAQVIETYRDGVLNDMPTTAGLNAITTRLCALPNSLVKPEELSFFRKMKAASPIVPLKEVTDNGKAVTELSAAQTYDPKASNSENPELYAIWPFQLYGVGLPNIDFAREAYKNRVNHLDVGWGYDGDCAALLGMTDEAARIIQIKCANSNTNYRWPATWGPNYDWLPDQNHGGNLLETTQLMLLQNEGQHIYLLPAWPKTWDVSFKLHAALNTTVECVYVGGKVTSLKVTPESRRKDIVLPD